jgi:formylglycine-generating enzyme required for sulfatase activity
MEEKVSNAAASTEAYTNAATPTAPAVGMTRAQAEEFAARVVPGGRLPTPEEWDAAAGYYAKPRPERLAKGVPTVNVAAPTPSRKDTPTADRGIYGLLDMAGNGAEWTSGTLEGDRPRAITRGRNFLFKDPLTFAILDAEQTQPKAAFADQGNKYTGFRIAIPAPPVPGK